MSKPKSAPKPDLPSFEVWLIRACFALALGISLFLAWNSFQGGGVPGCGPDSGCDKVLSSRWGYVFGLPISIFAVPIYIALLALVRPVNLRWRLAMPLVFLVMASALWFVGLQTFVLRAFCKFCMTAHAAGVFASLLLLRKAPLPTKTLITSLGVAGAAAAGLVVAQAVSPERGPKQIVSAAPIAPTTAPSTSSTSLVTSPSPQPVPAPTFSIVDGLFTLDLTKVPVTGPLNAPKKLAKLFDFSCHHCRDLHHLLSAFRAKHSNELAVVSLPLPLDSKCNPTIRRTQPAHVNACEYARYGLAVYQVKPEKFEEYSDWIYAPALPPEVSRAREYAANLVGKAEFEKAVESPAITDQIQLDIKIYTEAYKRSHSGQLPQMYFEHGASIGAVQSAEQLEKIMAENLGFPLSPK